MIPASALVTVYLVLLSSAFLIVVEDVLPDVLPALVLSWNVVHAAFPEFILTALLVPHSHRHQHSYSKEEERVVKQIKKSGSD